MKAELNFMWNDFKITFLKAPIHEKLIAYIICSTLGAILLIANIYIFVVMTFALYAYWYLTAWQHCRKNKKKEPKAIEDKTFDPIV